MDNQEAFIKLVGHPLKFRLFLLQKLPMALLAGVKIESLTPMQAAVSVPYNFLTKNPFRSIYFACLAMAAELSTGLPAMMHVYKSNPTVSMLVTQIQGDFMKKAVGKIIFTCDDGAIFEKTVERAISLREPQTITAETTGRNTAGEVVAAFNITWSFKVKE